ncbi:MAG: aminoacyl-tRNA hydrolase [Acidimicrobiia bacterium]|nr:aminoacyl-tRNA hydrolase [Acidimicrobiia bacterium]
MVVGLRNPGSQYEGTRHNVGAEVVERLADGEAFSKAPKRIRGQVATVRLADRPVHLLLPTTFMNESGQAVAPLARYYGVGPEAVLLVHDDIDLPFAKMRLQHSRGAGGHNGVSSVVRSLSTDGVWRLKLGVGRPPGRQDPADFVLRRFSKAERPDVDLMVVEAADVVRSFAADGGEAARQAAGDASARLRDDLEPR